jgi:hypothetical protein
MQQEFDNRFEQRIAQVDLSENRLAREYIDELVNNQHITSQNSNSDVSVEALGFPDSGQLLHGFDEQAAPVQPNDQSPDTQPQQPEVEAEIEPLPEFTPPSDNTSPGRPGGAIQPDEELVS